MEKIIIVYTGIYIPIFVSALSIAFSTLITMNDKLNVNSNIKLLVIYIIAFSLKVYIDDLSHFVTRNRIIKKKIYIGLCLSIIFTILVSSALVVSNINYTLSCVFIIISNLIGTLWIIFNYGVIFIDKMEARHFSWFVINLLNIIMLILCSLTVDVYNELNLFFIIMLLIILIIDFSISNGIKRLID